VPGPHGFTVRVSVARLATPSASIASRLTFRDDAHTPLFVEAGCARDNTISDFRKEKYFGFDRQDPISLIPLAKSRFLGKRFAAPKASPHSPLRPNQLINA